MRSAGSFNKEYRQILLALAHEFDEHLLVAKLKRSRDKQVYQEALATILPQTQRIYSGLLQACHDYAQVNQKFFLSEKNWQHDLGLTLFPVITFFDDCLLHLEQDILSLAGSKVSLAVFSLGFSREKYIQIQQALQRFYGDFLEQSAGFERESADRFVWHYSEFLEDVDALLGSCSFLFQQQKQLIFGLRYATRSFFIAEGEGWQDTAMTAMGGVIGSLATSCLPKQEDLMVKIKKMSKRHLATTLGLFFDQQRLQFQGQLKEQFEKNYEKVVDEITLAWQNYGSALQRLRENIEYLQKLV